METFELTPLVRQLVDARNALKSHYHEVALRRGCSVQLEFTLDGNLVGDIGEAIAVELFGVMLDASRSSEGIDGYVNDGRTSVQIKATGKGLGPAFRQTRIKADHLIFLDLDFETATGQIVFNGPLAYVSELLPETFIGQRAIPMARIRLADSRVAPIERLSRID
jgi:Family of unknown function (DUF6998)